MTETILLASPVPVSRPPVPWWARMFAVVGVVVVVGMLLLGTFGAVVAVSTTERIEVVTERDVRELAVVAGTGSVQVSTDPGLGDGVEVRIRARSVWQEPEFVSERDGDVVEVGVRCPRETVLDRCDATFDVVVGPDTDLRVDLGTGGVDGADLAGDVQVLVARGGVSLDRLTSDDVDIRVGTGGIALHFDKAPMSVLGRTDVGGVNVTVPDDGTRYDVLSSSEVGDDRVDIATSRDAPRVIDVQTQVGGSEISYR